MRQILDFNENWWFIHADVDVSEARPGEGEQAGAVCFCKRA